MGSAIDQLRSVIADAAIMTDFDGTLSPMVRDPEQARPFPGALRVLSELADLAAVVGVVSGRPVEFLARHVTDPRIHLSGIYGLEHREDGVVIDVPEAERWAAPIAAAAADLRVELPAGAHVEEKRVSITVHYRRRVDLAPIVKETVAAVAARHGLEARRARMAVEVHPTAAPDKGSVVEGLAKGGQAACFLGDDVGDLPAFDALDRLADMGLFTVRVAVRSPEVSPELIERADVVVDGPGGAVAWLHRLA